MSEKTVDRIPEDNILEETVLELTARNVLAGVVQNAFETLGGMSEDLHAYCHAPDCQDIYGCPQSHDGSPLEACVQVGNCNERLNLATAMVWSIAKDCDRLVDALCGWRSATCSYKRLPQDPLRTMVQALNDPEYLDLVQRTLDILRRLKHRLGDFYDVLTYHLRANQGVIEMFGRVDQTYAIVMQALAMERLRMKVKCK